MQGIQVVSLGFIGAVSPEFIGRKPVDQRLEIELRKGSFVLLS